MSEKIIVELELDAKTDKKAYDKVETQSKKLGKDSGKKFKKGFKAESKGATSGISTALKAIAPAIAALGLGKLFFSGITLAQKQEDAINSLNVALKISGKYTEAASQQMQDLASDIQSTTRFGDEELLETAGLIQQLGNLTVKELGEATRVTADFASALNIDLRSAATLVGKAAVGEIGSFSRYGVVIKKGANNAETFARTLETLNSKFGGSAAGKLNTFSGAMDQLGNTFGDTLEQVGFFITESDDLIGLLKGGVSYLNDFAGGLRGIRVGILGMSEAGQSPLQELDNGIAKSMDTLQDLQKTLESSKEGVFGLGKYIGLSVEDKRNLKEVPEKIKALNLQIDAQLKKRQKLLDERGGKKTDDGKEEKKNEKKIEDAQLFANAKIETDKIITRSSEARQEALQELLNRKLVTEEEFSLGLIQIKTAEADQLAALEQKKSDAAINSSNDIAGAMVSAAKNSKISALAIGKTMNTLAVKGFGDSMQKIGAALATGDNINQAFVDSVKATASQAASAFGDYYIAEGVAEVAATHGASGYATIAGGSALKVLSGVLGSGGGASSASSGTSVSGASGSISETPDLESSGIYDEQTQERANPNTNVEIKVEGSLVHQEELGQFITDTLNNSFEKQGVTLSGAFA